MFNSLIHYRKVIALLALIVLPAMLQISCGNGGSSVDTKTVSPPTIRTVTVSWNANHETAVNAPGGGYKVYYSTSSGFDISDAGVGVVDVPFVAPPTTPTSVSLQLVSGQYYFRVVAYSTLVAPWGSGGSMSAPSAQIALLVP